MWWCIAQVTLFPYGSGKKKWYRVKINERLTVLDCQWCAMHINSKNTYIIIIRKLVRNTYTKYRQERKKERKKARKKSPQMNHIALVYANNFVCWMWLSKVSQSTKLILTMKFSIHIKIQWGNATQFNVITFTSEAAILVNLCMWTGLW